MVGLVLVGVLLLLLLAPGYWVRQVMAKYSEPADRYPGTGGQLARHLLDSARLSHVTAEATDAGDHYDPVAKAVRLSESNYRGRSLTAITVAAHEVGHALQDRDGFTPFLMRQKLVTLATSAQKFSGALLLLAPILLILVRSPRAALVPVFVGVGAMLLSALVHLLTLPTELDASFGRAMPLLQQGGYLKQGDVRHAKRVLRAAAFTYVAASLASVLNLSRWIAMLRR